MIRRTIKEHLDKELRLNPKGIKVLSLFFIDHVDNYRQYDASGNPVKGEYAKVFETEYRRAMKLPEYASLLKDQNPDLLATEVHEGYFSIDKKGVLSDTQENNQGNRDNAERAYNLIMKDKERLLSFETPLKFIFSHSALREGWDNPNVFQICALRDMASMRERRQTIGRGLRLCVNQQGERIRGFDVNTLTVIAMESYQDFAENLQKEIEEDTGIRFGLVEKHQFAGIPVLDEHGQPKPLGVEHSQAIWAHLRDQGFVDAKGKVQDTLRTALKEGTLTLPDTYADQLPLIVDALKKVAGKLNIKNADERKTIMTRQAILHGEAFKALWDRIKHKTTYRVAFDNEALIKSCTEAISKARPIPKTRMTWQRANLAIGKAGVDAIEKDVSGPVYLEEQDIELPDILTELQDKTQLTRKSLARILTESGRLNDFKKNPQAFIEITTEAINDHKRLALVQGIRYQKVGDQVYYAQELFEQEELTGYLKNMMEATKSVHEYVVYDSTGIEKSFAEDLEMNTAVKVYAKLPGWFKVHTPLGTYNPDWAVLVEQEGQERIYFVVETKGTFLATNMRQKENAKIDCGKEHFKALSSIENPAKFVVARTVKDVMGHVSE
jgi:type III restriction enzyme